MKKKQRNYLIIGLLLFVGSFLAESMFGHAVEFTRGQSLAFTYLKLILGLGVLLYTALILLKRPYFYGIFLFSLTVIGLELFAGHFVFLKNADGPALLALFDKTTESPQRYVRLREHSPNQDRMLPSRANPEKREVRIRTNQDGFIEPSGEFGKSDLDIVFLGGSTTACIEVDELKRFPYLVGELLSTNAYQDINAVNAGVSANHSMHSNNNLINKLVDKSPDYVVFMHNINDLMIQLRYGTYWNNRFDASLLVDEKNVDFSNKGAVSKVDLTLAKKERIKDDFENSLTQFIYTCKAWDIKPVLMTQFNLFDETMSEDLLTREMATTLNDNIDEFVTLYDSLNMIIRNVAIKHQIELIDLAEEIPQESKYFYDVVHLTDEGSELVAGVINKHFVKFLQTNINTPVER